MSTDTMPVFDSLSFALLIPFAICFILIFLVCCFADEIKDICRMPSPLPASYLAAERTRPRRRIYRLQSDEARNLILSEEGRSRNVSESSSDHVIASIAPSTSVPFHGRTVIQAPPALSNNMNVISEAAGVSKERRNIVPSSSNQVNCTNVSLKSAPHTVMRNSDDSDIKGHFLRNLSMNTSVLNVPAIPYSCANLTGVQSANSSKSSTEDTTSIVRNKSAPYALNKYLTTVLPSVNSNQTTNGSESGVRDDKTTPCHESRKS